MHTPTAWVVLPRDAESRTGHDDHVGHRTVRSETADLDQQKLLPDARRTDRDLEWDPRRAEFGWADQTWTGRSGQSCATRHRSESEQVSRSLLQVAAFCG